MLWSDGWVWSSSHWSFLTWCLINLLTWVVVRTLINVESAWGIWIIVNLRRGHGTSEEGRNLRRGLEPPKRVCQGEKISKRVNEKKIRSASIMSITLVQLGIGNPLVTVSLLHKKTRGMYLRTENLLCWYVFISRNQVAWPPKGSTIVCTCILLCP